MTLLQRLRELSEHIKQLGLDDTPTLLIYDEEEVVRNALIREFGPEQHAEISLQPNFTYGGIAVVNSAD